MFFRIIVFNKFNFILLEVLLGENWEWEGWLFIILFLGIYKNFLLEVGIIEVRSKLFFDFFFG